MKQPTILEHKGKNYLIPEEMTAKTLFELMEQGEEALKPYETKRKKRLAR